MRTVFRRLEKAENMFNKKLLSLGYTSLKLKNMLKDETWILNHYENIASSKNEELSVKSIAL